MRYRHYSRSAQYSAYPRIEKHQKRAVYSILLLSALLSIPLITAAPGISPFASGWAQVETQCSGLTASQVESMVTDLLSKRILSLPRVLDVYSSSTADKSLLLLRSPWYLQRNEIMSQLLKAVERVRPRLPNGAQEPKVSYIENSSPPILLGITPKNREGSGSLPAHPETIAHTLRRLPRFSEVELYGLSEKEVHINIDPYLLGPSSLTLAGTRSTISSSLFNFTAGGTVEHNISIPVEISGGVDSFKKLRELPLEEAGGHTRLSEIAGISSTYKRKHDIRVNGKRGLIVSAIPGERGKIPLLTALFHLMEPEKPITGAFPGWQVSVLSNPYRALVRSSLSTAALVSITSAAALLIAVHYRAAGAHSFKSEAFGSTAFKSPAFKAHIFFKALCVALSAAGIILSLVYALYPLSAAPGQPPPSGNYRRFFLIEDTEIIGKKENSLAYLLEQSTDELPAGTEMWTIPASLCGFSAHSVFSFSSSSLPIAARAIAEDITSLFIRSSSVQEVLSLLQSRGFVPVPAASPAIEILEKRNRRSGTDRDTIYLGDKREKRLTIIPHHPSLPEDIPGSGGITEIMEAAFDGIRLGTMESRGITALETHAAPPTDSLFAARKVKTPVYLFYGKEYLQDRSAYSVSSLPAALSEAVPPLREITEITSSVELRRIVSLNGSPVRYRFLPCGAENMPSKE